MKIEQLKSVVKRYGKAWGTKDTKLLLTCFTKNGIYQESPLAKPHRGHKEIASFWDKVVCKETWNIKFKLKKCHLSKDGKTGFAEWQCKNEHQGEKHEMVGIMLLKMKGSKIIYLNEYWNTKISRL